MDSVNPHVLRRENREGLFPVDVVKSQGDSAIRTELSRSRNELHREALALQYHLRTDGMMRPEETDQAVHAAVGAFGA